MQPGQGTVTLLLVLTALRWPGHMAITWSMAKRVPWSGCMDRYLRGHVAIAPRLVPAGADSQPTRPLSPPEKRAGIAAGSPSLLLAAWPTEMRKPVVACTGPVVTARQIDSDSRPDWRSVATLSSSR